MDEFDKRHDAGRSGVADRIANRDSFGAAFDGGGVEFANHLRCSPGGVFGHVHHRQAVLDAKGDRFFSQFQHLIQSPFLGVDADGRRADEGGGFDGETGFLGNFHQRFEVGKDRANGAVRADFHFVSDDFLGQPENVLLGMDSGAG